jgi:hypothetical protein
LNSCSGLAADCINNRNLTKYFEYSERSGVLQIYGRKEIENIRIHHKLRGGFAIFCTLH